MIRAAGIDPGTKSFDLVVLEDGKVVFEESIPTVEVASDPMKLVEAIPSDVDVIGGPSGYGVPVTLNKDILNPRRFAVEVLLLSRERDIARGVARGDTGIMVYDSLAKAVESLWRKQAPVVYIPSVILLPTVPPHRKFNKIDMGTADKMAIAVLEVGRRAINEGLDIERQSFIVVEMGYGYNAVIGVREGRIVDGLGGTVIGPGFLTGGPIDGEVAQLVGTWRREDVFYGGVSTACKTLDPAEALERRDMPCASALKAMVEAIAKAVYGMARITKSELVLLSGRLSGLKGYRKLVTEILDEDFDVRFVEPLPGAKLAKRAAQGYAMVADGLAGGIYKEVILHMGIPKARGTVVDYLVHPSAEKVVKRIRRAYAESVSNPLL